jgi:hypothetical protein
VNPILAASSWVPAASTLVGIIIGAAASIAGGSFSQWFTWLSPINSKPASGYRIKTSHFYG